jgi:hypothetical protein
LQQSSFLGIYLAKDRATVACFDVQGQDRNLTACFGVSLERAGEPDMRALAGAVATAIIERQIKFTEAAIALDCAMFMQHSVHSEFSDVKKITQTVRFDTEEVLGADATDVAIAFKIDTIDQTGSNLSVFTAQKQMLSELLSALQANNIDPVSVEPDVNCLARFVLRNISLPADAHPLFALLSRRNGYFITPLSSSQQGVSPASSAAMRTFLLGASQNKDELLIKQVSMTAALLQSTGAVDRLEVIDSANLVNCGDIAKKLAIQTELIDIIQSAKLPTEKAAECPDAVEFAIACGAALVNLDLSESVNWRSDFMPYQGRKMRLQNALKVFCIAAVVFMFALGLYGLMEAMQANKYRARLREKFDKEYSAVMLGQSAPVKSKEAVTRIGTTLRRIKDAQKGFSITGEEAVAAKLSLVLEAFNKCAEATSLHIETVNITDKAITVSGDTSSRGNTLKVFEAMRQNGLNVLHESLSTEGGRDTFRVTIEPRKQTEGKG